MLAYTTSRDLTDYSSGDNVITLLLDSAISDNNNLSISYSGTSVVDASNASSSAGLQLSGFTDEVVVNTRVDNPLLTDANMLLMARH